MPDVHLASSIALHAYSSVVQKTDEGHPVFVFGMQWNGRDTQVVSSQRFDLSNRPLGTRVAAGSVLYDDGEIFVSIFSQREGDDIVQSTRSLEDDWDEGAPETSENILPS